MVVMARHASPTLDFMSFPSMPELLIDIDPALEAAFARYGALAQGILESLPWEEAPASPNNPRRRFVAKVYSTHTFWASLWRPRKAFWQAQGFAIAKPDADWRVVFTFTDPARRTEALRQSAAVESSGDSEIPVPAGLAYYEYQKAGVQFLDTHAGSLLADDPGLGKTIQVCGLLNLRPEIRSVLIVCPCSVKYVWARELARWLTDESRTVGIAGTTLDASAEILVCNYDLLRKFAAQLKSRRYDLLVLDEAHYIKTSGALRTKACKLLGALTARKVLLTGTPIMNRPAELWSLLNFLDAKAWGPFFPFALHYCDARKGPFGWDFDGASNLGELNDRLRTSGTMLRRRKVDVLPQLPRVTRQVVPLPVDMTPVLEELTERLAELMGFDPDNPPFEIDPVRIPFELIAVIRRETGTAKIQAALAFIADETQDVDKIVIYAHHHDVLKVLHEALTPSILVTGQTSAKARARAVASFQELGGPRYFIGSIGAMSVGITLTAASRVIFVEQSWTPAEMEQAECRLHRIGQNNAVLSQYLVVRDSIDEKILSAVVSKMRVIEAVLEEMKVSR
jgi:SWI/SNF-related matrix-associated actin-dependent regulator 1 of chromatin subfamily A